MVGRNQGALVTGGALLGITVAVGAAMAVRRRSGASDVQEQKGEFDWLAQAGVGRFPAAEAGVFELHDLNRRPDARLGGAGVLRCSDTGSNVPMEALFEVPGLVLYSIEIVEGELLLLFMQVPSMPEAFNTPFLDRGVRAVAEIGSKVYVARLDTVEASPGLTPVNQLPEPEQARYSFVWNTGRCGSTLMHKMLQKVGVLSFSEPYWLDRLCDLSMKGMGQEEVGKLFGVCAATDVLLARASFPAHPPVFGVASTLGSGYVSFNPKGKCFMVMEPIMKAVPAAKHLLMYRDVRKVTESFGSIFTSIFREDIPLRDKLLGLLPFWSTKSPSEEPPPVQAKGGSAPTFSKAVAQALASGGIVRPSNPMAGLISMGWMETMCLWKEMLESRFGVRSGGTASLRMEDFTRKDPELIETVLQFVLGEEVEIGEDAVTTALEVFKRHSQAGDVMERSSHKPGSGKAKFLSPTDIREIEAVAEGLSAIGSPDHILPGSLGAPASQLVRQ